MKRLKFVSTLAALLVVVSAASWRWSIVRRGRLAEQIDKTEETMNGLAREVLSLRMRNGGFPTNEQQLISLLGKSLPRTAWDTEISYSTTNGFFFILAHSPYPQLLILEFDSRRSDIASYPF